MGQQQSSNNATMSSAHTAPIRSNNNQHGTNEPADKPDRTVNNDILKSTYYATRQDADDLIDPSDTIGERM